MKQMVSIIIPVYNEQDILEKQIAEFVRYFTTRQKGLKFEIIIADNGSTDHTLQIAIKLKKEFKNIVVLHGESRGLGIALKEGILHAKYPFIYFNAIDNPFGFKDYEKFIRAPDSDLIFCSKTHPQSQYHAPLLRTCFSRFFAILTRILFSLTIHDTQGTFYGSRKKLLQILPFCDASSAFFQAQLAIYAVNKKLMVTEVPITYFRKKKASQFFLVRDGLQLFFQLIWQRMKLH